MLQFAFQNTLFLCAEIVIFKQTNILFSNFYPFLLAVQNLICYNYINDGKEVEVTKRRSFENLYEGDIVIPKEVTYNNETLQVTVNIKEGIPSDVSKPHRIKEKDVMQYNLNGAVIQSPQKGINIIKMDNGSTKKIFVK